MSPQDNVFLIFEQVVQITYHFKSKDLSESVTWSITFKSLPLLIIRYPRLAATMNIRDYYANSLDLQSIAITLFEWNFGRVAHGFRMKK